MRLNGYGQTVTVGQNGENTSLLVQTKESTPAMTVLVQLHAMP